MTYKDLGALTDPLEAVKSLFAEMTAMKGELSATKSDVARLNRNNTKLVVENRSLKVELAQTKEELARLKKEVPVEKDSTNSSIPPTKQSIAKQIIQHTSSLRKPSGKNPGGQPGHAGHSLDKNTSPDKTIEHKAKTCPFCGHAIPEDAEQVCVKTIQEIEITGPMQPCSVTEHKYYSAVCTHCHKAARAESVTGDCKKVMYGPVLQTMVVYLSVVQSVPYNRIAEIMRDIFKPS